MVKHRTERISVNYDVPIEELAKVEIGIPYSYRQGSIYMPRLGKSIPQFNEKILGPFEIRLAGGINSNNFPRIKTGVRNYEVTLFEKHPGVGYPRPGRELLEGIKEEGYELADPWQVVEYLKTYPRDHIFDIVGAANKPIALCYGSDSGTMGNRILRGLSLKLLDFPKDLEYVKLALGIWNEE